jgi:drug/metabolite transporter (DMT)-like permease
MTRDRLLPIGCVLLAGSLWGTIGTAFELILDRGDATPITVVTLRAATATTVIWLWIGLRDRGAARIDRRDGPAFVAMGLVTISLFYVSLIYLFRWTSISTGTILLYLAPALVAAGSWVLFRERLSSRQLSAAGLSLAGCFLAAGALDAGAQRASLGGILLGLASASCYGAYSLFGKRLLDRYSATTMLAWVFSIGAAGLLATKLILEPGSWPSLHTTALIVGYSGFVTTLAPLVLFTLGLRSLPSGIASTAATIEPVVAVTIAAFVLGEPITAAKIAGGGLVVVGVLVLTWSTGQTSDASAASAEASSLRSSSVASD